MFENLSGRLGDTLKKLRGQGRLSEENIKEALREVRMALLEADVALPVVKEFIGKVKERAVGQEVSGSITPGQAFIKIVNDELTAVMGAQSSGLDLRSQPPAVILMAGLQGAGKTTTVGKLAKWLIEREKKKKVMVVSGDVYRPAAIKQLETVAGQVGAEFISSAADERPVKIAQRALEEARKAFADVLIVDTAGRLHVDEEMMEEIRALHAAISPVETLFVVDAMTGQDAANTAQAFNQALPLTGVVLTKSDGDARGGAALSVRHITGKPIKFLGTGEKMDGLEAFHPDRIASRILGMGDVVSLVEEVQAKVDHAKAEKLTKKLKKGKGLTLEDLRDQMLQMQQLGGLAGLMDKLPGAASGMVPNNIDADAGEREMKRMVAIINSMTPKERRKPDIINGSRKRRIAKGSGTQIQDVNRVLKQHTQMQKMMKKAGKGGMAKMMRGMGGKMPPGFPPM